MGNGDGHGPSPWGLEVWIVRGRVLPGLCMVELAAVTVTITPSAVVATTPRN